MKKRPSLTAVSGRTCPHCLIEIDPVCYGWHLGKCSSKKLASTSKHDMAPGTPIKNEAAGHLHFLDAAVHVVSPREASTLARDSQIGKDAVTGSLPSSGDNVVQSLDSSNEELERLREENQTLKKDLKLKSEVNEALNDKLKDLKLKLEEKTVKVKSLELKLEGLERKLSKETENKAACSFDPSPNSSRERSAQGNEEDVYSQPTQSSREKPLGLVGSNNQFCDEQVEVVNNVKEKILAMDSAMSDDLDKKLDLDRIVDLACGECAMSHDFLSHVDGVIKAKEAVPSIVNTSRKQRILSGMLCNASNEDENQEIAGKIGNRCSTDFDVPNLQNEFSPKEERVASHTSKPFQNVVNKEVPCMSSTPRDAIGNQCFKADFINTRCAMSLQADGHGVAKVNGDLSGMLSACMTDVGAHGLAPEMQHHAVKTSVHVENPQTAPSSHVSLEGDSDLKAKQLMQEQLPSTSASTEPEINVVKTKSGFRRMVLQSDSESDNGNIQGIYSGKNTHQAQICDSRKRALPPVSSNAEGEESEGFSDGFWVKSACTSGKASQPHLRRRKRLNMVCISDQSDDAICKGESEQSYYRSAEAVAIDLEGVGGDAIPDGEHAGVRRSKRLREMLSQNPKNSLQKESMRAEKYSSSSDETNANLEGSEVSKSGTSVSIYNEEYKTQVKRKGPSRTRKRLFEDVESKPLYGNKHSLDSEDDDSEIDSDADSLKGFITESEGIESTGYSSEHHSSNSSYSSQEVYHDPRHKRGIKIRNYVWELEGEMLSMLAIDPELCLRAVCALNRRQTEDEQKEKISKYANKRGFDKLHATRGSRLAEFLTDGDISGPVKKSLEDLNKFDAGGLKFCQMLASKHSKQLFEMYSNAEDPHFPYA